MSQGLEGLSISSPTTIVYPRQIAGDIDSVLEGLAHVYLPLRRDNLRGEARQNRVIRTKFTPFSAPNWGQEVSGKAETAREPVSATQDESFVSLLFHHHGTLLQ